MIVTKRFLLATIWIVVAAAGCTIDREVDFSAPATTGDLSAYFESASYAPNIEQFMQIGWYASPSVSTDGRRVFFVSGNSGVSQLYSLTDKGWPYQLTTFPDGIDWYVLSHSADMAIVGTAVGGTEHTQMYLLDVHTGKLRPLTDTPEVQYGSVVWNRDDKSIFFRSNLGNLKDFKLYRMDLISNKADLLVNAEGWNSWSDLSLDGKTILYSKSTSNTNNDLYLYDLEIGTTEYLTPHEGDIRYADAYFSADANALYLICNSNPHGLMQRAKLDLLTKEITYFESDSLYDVDQIVMSPQRDIMVWIVNQDGWAGLRMASMITGEDLPVPPMTGMCADPTLSETSRLVFSFDSPTQTSDIWSWEWKTGRTEQLTYASYAGLDPKLFSEPRLIKYKSFDSLEVPAFLYLPPGYTNGPIPFIVKMHGGPETQYRPHFSRFTQYLLLNGFGLLAPNVRGSSGYGKQYLAMDDYKLRMNSVRDMKAGAEWLMAGNYSRVGMIGLEGTSYGGYMVMAGITEYPDLFSAAVDEVGIVNFISFLENTAAYRRDLRAMEYGPLADSDFLTSISPINKASLIRTPLLVIHGQNDPRVPVSEARQIIEAISNHGGVVDSLIFPDEGHGINKLNNRLTAYRRMAEFLKKYLSPSSPNPGTKTQKPVI